MKRPRTVDDQAIVINVLPGEHGGETEWFDRLNEFQQQETKRQVTFKRKHWPKLPSGPFAKQPNRFYPHILPADSSLELALFPRFAKEALTYFHDEHIEVHSEFLNLKSSQACCVNFLYPLRQDHRLAARVLNGILGDVKKVTCIEFEYTGPEGITPWLGEPAGGKRGQYRTSIDAAVFWDDRKGQSHCTLIEWKYTEANYGGCSAYADGETDEKDVCQALKITSTGKHAAQCMLTYGGDKRSRNYWQRLDEAGISTKQLASAKGCPFQGAFYQLMRQHLLAHYLRLHSVADHADILSIGFPGNKSLRKVPGNILPIRHSAEGILEVWNRMLTGIPEMRHIDISLIMRKFDSIGDTDPDWRAYIRERYGV